MNVERIPVTDRATWLQLRLQDLTASDIPAVAGLDGRRTHLSVWAEKTGQTPGTGDNASMRRGRWLEPAVIEAMREQHPDWDIRRAGVYLRDPELRMGATPDAIVKDPAREGLGVIQCKVVSRPVFEAEWEDGKPPLKFEIQTLAEAMLADTWGMVAALVIDTFTAELVEFEVPRYAKAEDRIKRIVRSFWKDLEAGKQPKPDYTKDAETISAIYAEMQPGKAVDLSGDNRIQELLGQRADLKAIIKNDQRAVDEIDAEIRHKIGDAEEALVPGWKVTNRTQHRKEYYVAAKSFRVLRITDKREKEAL